MEKEQEKESKKSEGKMSWYKQRIIAKLDKQKEEYMNASPSWIFFNRLGGLMLDSLGWIILFASLYIGWKSGKWANIDCSKISVDMCNGCFGQMREIINNMSLGLPNLSIGR